MAIPANPFDLIPGSDDPFAGPAPKLNRPRPREMYGRLLLISPSKVEKVKAIQGDDKVDRMTATVVILDGGTLNYGGAPEDTPPRPHTLQAETPFEVLDMYISSVGVVNQCRDALNAKITGKGSTMVLGRLSVGEKKDPTRNAPYFLTDPTDEDKAIARAYLANRDPFA